MALNREERLLMQLGREVVATERVFGAGSTEHQKAVARWQKQQKKLGVA